jgi:hypothetical protein
MCDDVGVAAVEVAAVTVGAGAAVAVAAAAAAVGVTAAGSVITVAVAATTAAWLLMHPSLTTSHLLSSPLCCAPQRYPINLTLTTATLAAADTAIVTFKVEYLIIYITTFRIVNNAIEHVTIGDSCSSTVQQSDLVESVKRR